MKKLYLSMILCFCTLLGAAAQTETDALDVTDSKNFKQWSVDLGVGLSIPKGTAGWAKSPGNINAYNSDNTKNHRFWNPNANVGVRYMFNNLFGLKINAGLINLYNKKNSPFKYDTKYVQGSFEGVLNLGRLMHMEEFSQKFNLLLHGGVGASFNWSNKVSKKSHLDKTPYFVGGLTTQYFLTNSVALQLDLNAQKHYMQQYSFDKIHIGSGKGFEETIWSATLGLAVYLGGANKKEKPHADWYYIKRATAPPAYIPTTPAELLVDADGDGVPDYIDMCPDEPGLKEFRGCPDTDGDGVPDYKDKCPNTPIAEKNNVDASGCLRDRDGDGIPDYLDACPDVAGIKENNGCPEIKKEVKHLFQKALQGIQFETGKSIIRKSSHNILDQIVRVLIDNPEYRVEIQGHTDSTGDTQRNLELSGHRADAVLLYLMSNGVSESRMTSKGYGITRPVADNNTAAGRAKNRRVEFVISFEKAVKE